LVLVNRTNWQKSGRIFFPRADTSGCTKEALQFSSLYDAFTEEKTVVIGISKDKPAKLARFRLKHNLTCLLGTDHETDLCEQFGVWVKKSMYGKNFMGVQRSSFIIDNDRKIIKIWPKVKVEGHAQDVLTSVKGLRA
jgi:peroxiredoxin Q/BCP